MIIAGPCLGRGFST